MTKTHQSHWLIALFLLLIPAMLGAQETPAVDRFQVGMPDVVLADVPFDITIEALDAHGNVLSNFSDTLLVLGLAQKTRSGTTGLDRIGPFTNGSYTVANAVVSDLGETTIRLRYDQVTAAQSVRVIPGFLSILPPVLAILMALLLRQVVLSLFFGVWLGAIFLNGYNPVIGFLRALDQFVIGSAADPNNAAVMIFSLMLGGMVGIISKSGGTAGIVESLARYAKNRRSGQVATWAMGLFIFFDDYSNSLVVGNTMRPLTDRLRISREKLSYIVDSTAAPIASIAFISTWVGFQSGQISLAFSNMGLTRDGYFVFFQSIPFSFYCILTLFAVLIIGLTNRDFGAMLTAEKRVIATGAVLREGAVPITDTKAMEMDDTGDIPLRWYNAVVPVLVMVFVSFTGLFYSGYQQLGADAAGASLVKLIGAANSFHALLWGTTTGVLVAGIMTIRQKILTLPQAIDAWLSGLKSMLLAIAILVLAWSIGSVCGGLNTAGYIVQTTQGLFTPNLLPAITFVVAAVIAFSTGSSWATMAILTPLVVPLSHQMTLDAAIAPDLGASIMLAAIAAVLSGSVFGDHASPISDTTILSSMASGSDHIDHVRTQIPYAFSTAAIAIVFGYIPAGFGISPVLLIPVGIACVWLLIRFVGKKHVAA